VAEASNEEIHGYICDDIDVTIRAVPGLQWNFDKSKKFDADFKYNNGSFSGLLAAIDRMLNHDGRLPESVPFDWTTVANSPGGLAFPDVFLSRTVGELEAAYCVLPAGDPYAAVGAEGGV